MLYDHVIGRDQLLRLVGVSEEVYENRAKLGLLALAFGLDRPAKQNLYLPDDGAAILQTSMLSVGIGLKAASRIVRERWMLSLALLQRVEEDPRLGEPRHPDQQLFMVVALTSDGHELVEGGLMADALQRIAADASVTGSAIVKIHGVSIERLRRQLYANGRLHQIPLPERLTVARDAPRYRHWLAEIEGHRARTTGRQAAKLARRAAKRAQAVVKA
jgi:hypothetical protein